MGLLYLFPVQENESEHIQIDRENHSVRLSSYGLPYIFWFYAISIILIISLLTLAVYEPLMKLFSYGTTVDQLIFYSMLALVILAPITMLGFFFYEKTIIKTAKKIEITHKLFFIKIKTNTFLIETGDQLRITHHLDSPNMAKLMGDESHKHFQNKGYFELYLKNDSGKKIFLDRHSRKADLEKIKNLLEIAASN